MTSLRPYEYVPDPSEPRDRWGSRPCQSCRVPRKNQIHVESKHTEGVTEMRDRILGEAEKDQGDE